MVNRSKRYATAADKIDRSRQYDPKEALGIIKDLPA